MINNGNELVNNLSNQIQQAIMKLVSSSIYIICLGEEGSFFVLTEVEMQAGSYIKPFCHTKLI